MHDELSNACYGLVFHGTLLSNRNQGNANTPYEMLRFMACVF